MHKCLQRLLTVISRQADRLDRFRHWHSLIQPEQSDIVVEVGQAELLDYSAKHEASLRPRRRVTAIVFTKCHLYHKPHKSEKSENSG